MQFNQAIVRVLELGVQTSSFSVQTIINGSLRYALNFFHLISSHKQKIHTDVRVSRRLKRFYFVEQARPTAKNTCYTSFSYYICLICWLLRGVACIDPQLDLLPRNNEMINNCAVHLYINQPILSMRCYQ
jgi:hypothetical protein